MKPTRQSDNQRPRTAFTLIEVLLVLVILVVLAAMVVPYFGQTQEGALKKAAAADVSSIKRQISVYKLHTYSYPATLGDLVTKPGDAAIANRWEGPYLEGGKVPLDPWGREYRFAAPGKHNPDMFDVWSTGPDGQDGTADDIGNWTAT